MFFFETRLQAKPFSSTLFQKSLPSLFSFIASLEKRK